MGFDTECDLAIAADGDPRIARDIAAVRDRLLADHLGVDAGVVAAAFAETGSLIAVAARLSRTDHRLVPLEPAPPGWLDGLPEEAHLFDPAEPIAPDLLTQRLLPEEVQASLHHPFLRAAGTLLALSAAVAAAHGLGLDVVTLTAPARRLAGDPALVVGLFVAGGLTFVPVTVMIVLTVVVLGPLRGLAFAVLGVLTSAAVGYAVGRLLGRHLVRRIAGRRLNRLTARLARRGALAVAAARVLALAPFTSMNLVAGASRVPLRDYALGTVLGTVPGVIAIALGTDGVMALTHRFAIAGLALVAAVGAGALVVGLRLGRRARPSAGAIRLADAAGHA
jgi:uncharacterized membrane protein YdjX (TVP38/TMEM64 family)